MDIHEEVLEPTGGAGPGLEEIGSSSLSRAPTRSLESVQSGEAGSDQLPLLEGLEPWLQDIKSSVTQSLHWVSYGLWNRGCSPSQGR